MLERERKQAEQSAPARKVGRARRVVERPASSRRGPRRRCGPDEALEDRRAPRCDSRARTSATLARSWSAETTAAKRQERDQECVALGAWLHCLGEAAKIDGPLVVPGERSRLGRLSQHLELQRGIAVLLGALQRAVERPCRRRRVRLSITPLRSSSRARRSPPARRQRAAIAARARSGCPASHAAWAAPAMRLHRRSSSLLSSAARSNARRCRGVRGPCPGAPRRRPRERLRPPRPR